MEKNVIRVGGDSAVAPITGLPMFREHITFEANYKNKFIRVFYNQWLEANGVRVEEKPGRHYNVVNLLAVSHIVPGDINADPPTEDSVVEDSPAYPMFDGWQNKTIPQQWVGLRLGEDIILGAIMNTLQNIPFDAEDGYAVKPQS